MAALRAQQAERAAAFERQRQRVRVVTVWPSPTHNKTVMLMAGLCFPVR